MYSNGDRETVPVTKTRTNIPALIYLFTFIDFYYYFVEIWLIDTNDI